MWKLEVSTVTIGVSSNFKQAAEKFLITKSSDRQSVNGHLGVEPLPTKCSLVTA